MADPIFTVVSTNKGDVLVKSADGTVSTVTSNTVGLSLDGGGLGMPSYASVSFQTTTPEKYPLGAKFTLTAVEA